MIIHIHLEVYLKIDGMGTYSSGAFQVKSKKTVADAAYDFIKQIKRETGYRPTSIEKVIVNGTEDVTEAVLELENRPLPDVPDVFW